MSFLAGFVQQMNTIAERNERFRMEQRDRAERREMEMRRIIEERRNAVIPVVLTRMAEMQAFEKEEKAKQAFLIKQGLSPSTVAALTLAGQDDQVIATIQKAITDNKYDREFASDLDTFVTAKIKESGIDPEKLGSMLSEGLYGVDATTEEGRAMGVTQALMALMDTDEPFKAAEDMLASIISREQMRSDAPVVSLPGINLGAAVELGLTNQKKIKDALAATVAAQIAPNSYVKNQLTNTLEYTGGNKEVDDIVDVMYNEVISRGGEAGSPLNLTSAITESQTKFRNIYDRLGGSAAAVREAYGLQQAPAPADDTPDTPATGSATDASAVEQGATTPKMPALPRPEDPYSKFYQGQGGN